MSTSWILDLVITYVEIHITRSHRNIGIVAQIGTLFVKRKTWQQFCSTV